MSKKGENISITLIGLSNAENQEWPDDIKRVITSHSTFSGGDRHLERVQHMLPEKFEWIPIKGKMELVTNAYHEVNNNKIVVFASGDPFFFGFGNTLKRLLPNATIKPYPYFNSLQRLAHKTQLNYSHLHTISLHGRPWDELDEALISDQALIGILTDQKHGPKEIAERLLEYGYSNYEVIIGEELDGEKEKVTAFNLQDASNYDALPLNCLILRQVFQNDRPMSFPDRSYRTLKGRPNMITKQFIRAITLPGLQLHQANCFWDIGACTGSIAIEAKRNFPRVKTYAFEKREECRAIIADNMRSHQTPGIIPVIGDFFDQNLTTYDSPQAVFIGGHGGRLRELIEKINNYLDERGILVMNTVLESSYIDFIACTKELNYDLISADKVSINEHNPINVLVAQKTIQS
ncbi:MAG: precorrin-6y C5,15-methyltransferase (decarboxylating) subunit CbiE [Crocinitomicaceae bacterium]|nr:precorrin-6y C5,15-methyltransferase (decarboxylating) subunit CbiE [Crocinitomicaceae bacterium]